MEGDVPSTYTAKVLEYKKYCIEDPDYWNTTEELNQDPQQGHLVIRGDVPVSPEEQGAKVYRCDRKVNDAYVRLDTRKYKFKTDMYDVSGSFTHRKIVIRYCNLQND